MDQPFKITTAEKFEGNADNLKRKFNALTSNFIDRKSFYNTEAALIWIVNGAIAYFDSINSDFLGIGNEEGIPESQADHFANNIYRLGNALKYLSDLWGINFKLSKSFHELMILRTLIVHSGEANKIDDFSLADYKDVQLGRIFKKGHSVHRFKVDSDYAVQLWADKHDNTSKRKPNDFDYNSDNKLFLDIDIYIDAADVRNIVLKNIQSFVLFASQKTKENIVYRLPSVDILLNREKEEIDFLKISQLISKDERGGLIKENNRIIWYGFGLECMMEYIHKNKITGRTKQIIVNKIFDVMQQFIYDYQNSEKSEEDIQELDIRKIFKEYLLHYDLKMYLEGEKMFEYITPSFNTKEKTTKTDDDFLLNFIHATEHFFATPYNTEQSSNDIFCEYIYKSVDRSLQTTEGII